MDSGPVAIIDIGSNSIKALVALRAADGTIAPIKARSVDARISAGISGSTPMLSEEGMQRGVEAVRELLEAVAPFNPARTAVVATSAVRDALNGREFAERVRAETGHAVRVLTGEEEANLIGRGLAADPALRDLRDFYLFDLGGGSLECLAFRDRAVTQEMSLRLGCVRLTEKFVPDPAAPLAPEILRQIADHTREVLAQSGFAFNLPPTAVTVGTGGTLTTVRAIFAAREMKPFDTIDARIPVAELHRLLETLAEMPLARRRQISGLPRARADIFPVALATLIAVAEAGRFDAYHHSSHNLRFGLAEELLPPAAAPA